MDIALINKSCIRIKGKKGSFIVNPEKDMPKTAGDAILLTGSLGTDTSRVSESRVVIKGSGEYEVAGSKIAVVSTPKSAVYKLSIDSVSIILGKSVDFSKLESTFTACDIALINADSEFNESFITSLGPKVVVLYGENKLDAAKKLGVQNLSQVTKFSIAKDKLPEKMEIVVLG